MQLFRQLVQALADPVSDRTPSRWRIACGFSYGSVFSRACRQQFDQAFRAELRRKQGQTLRPEIRRLMLAFDHV